jgi:integrase
MAHIEDRWYRTVEVDGRSVQLEKPGCGRGMRYRVRYLDPAGKERSESFPDRRKREAQKFLARVQADILKGTYIDPDAGKTTFQQYTTEWLASANSDQNTRDRLERQFRLHVYPELGDRPLLAIQPATLRAWLRRLAESGLAASYQRNLFNDVSMIFNAAVDDKLVPGNPFAVKTVRAPRYVPAKVVPWSVARLATFRAAVHGRYRIAVDLGSGCGLRQGEIFGVSPDDIDRARPVLHVARQVKVIRQQLVFAAPKGGKFRDVPLPASVSARLRAHAAEYPPVAVTLPWSTLDGEPKTVPLYLTTAGGDAIYRPFSTPTCGSARSDWLESKMIAGMGCMFFVTRTRQCCSTRARASRRCRCTLGTPTQASPCGYIPTCCRAARTGRGGRLTVHSATKLNQQTARNP